MSDPDAVQARESHRLAADADSTAARHRHLRDQAVRRLRAKDPKRWTYPAIARAVGISPEMVAAIVKGRTGRVGDE